MFRPIALMHGVLPLAALIVLAGSCPAQPPGTLTPGEQDIRFVRTRAQNRPPAAAVPFNQTYNLPWSSLRTLGGRIDAARQAGDPVALGHLSQELGVAEKVSGKQAPLTSRSLLGEATELAKMRREASELRALLQMNQQIRQEKEVVAGLQNLLQQSQAQEQQQEVAASQPPSERPAVYSVLLENYTDEPISIFMNGRYQLTVRPLKKRFLPIVQQPAPVVLYGYSVNHSWGPRNIWETIPDYQWVLLPPGKDPVDPE